MTTRGRVCDLNAQDVVNIGDKRLYSVMMVKTLPGFPHENKLSNGFLQRHQWQFIRRKTFWCQLGMVRNKGVCLGRDGLSSNGCTETEEGDHQPWNLK